LPEKRCLLLQTEPEKRATECALAIIVLIFQQPEAKAVANTISIQLPLLERDLVGQLATIVKPSFGAAGIAVPDAG
jgi:hypothetical protein